ncbi:MAG: PDZ domain-containing protein, partial [Nanoarchaeota archaeon]|nr:PDZ domain-containing protein [Nanoarchaeota archaeon]
MKKLTWKIWLLIIVLVLSLLSIFGMPPTLFQKGVLVTSIESNSTAFEQGLRQGQIIIEIDGKSITSLDDFSNALQGKFDSDENVKTIINTKDSEIILFSNQAPEIIVSEIPKTNIKTGLDISGGARALVQAQDHELNLLEVNDLVEITRNRLNEFGLTELNVRRKFDLSGKNFMEIEIAGATPKDLEKLISEQGKFEAKIGNETVFIGGDRDITSVARSGQEAGIYSCEPGQGGYFCNFRFTVYLSEDAAKRHADITKTLGVNSTTQGSYLDQKLDLFLDDKLVNSLLISEGLQGRVTTQIAISGSGSGATKDEAITNAEQEMKQLQTILITGSLPFKLEIVKLDTISPLLGKEFIRLI